MNVVFLVKISSKSKAAPSLGTETGNELFNFGWVHELSMLKLKACLIIPLSHSCGNPVVCVFHLVVMQKLNSSSCDFGIKIFYNNCNVDFCIFFL